MTHIEPHGKNIHVTQIYTRSNVGMNSWEILSTEKKAQFNSENKTSNGLWIILHKEHGDNYKMNIMYEVPKYDKDENNKTKTMPWCWFFDNSILYKYTGAYRVLKIDPVNSGDRAQTSLVEV